MYASCPCKASHGMLTYIGAVGQHTRALLCLVLSALRGASCRILKGYSTMIVGLSNQSFSGCN